MSKDRRQSDTASFNSFKFTSSHATPQESRDRARHTDRSRSPQRDRFVAGRHERIEGERHESEKGGYDSYRPGQPSSRDMIPAPVRTSNGPPLSPHLQSTFNDSRRPSKIRSPSDSSPYRSSDRSTTSRTSTTSDQPTRPPAAGIKILGLSAKSEEDIKKREEAAKIYKANMTQQKSHAMPGQADAMDVAPVSALPGTLVDSTRLSWKDKAEVAEATNSKQEDNTTVSASDSSMTRLLFETFQKIIDELTEVSFLKARSKTAVAKFDKVKADFEKYRDHHEKFPSIKETQSNAKKAAEKQYKRANDQLEVKNSSLHQLAVKVAEQVVPSILQGGSSSQEQQKTQDRIDALERTCQKYDQLLQDQKSYLEVQQKANQVAAEESERKYLALAEEFRLLQDEVAKQRPRQDKLFLKQIEFAMAATNMSKEIGETKDGIAVISKIQIPHNLNEQLQKFSELDQLREKVKTVDDRSAITQSGLTTLTTTVGTLQKTFDARDATVEGLAQEQNKLRGTISGIDSRIGAVEAKLADSQELDGLKQRMTRIETAPPPPVAKQTIDPAFIAQLASLEEKIRPISSQIAKLADQNSVSNLNATVDRLDATLATTVDRVAQVEKQANTLKAVQKQLKPQNQVVQQPASPNAGALAAIESRVATIEKLHPGTSIPSIEHRISALEQEREQQLHQRSQAKDLHETEQASDLFNQVTKLQEDLASVSSSVDVMLEVTGATVTEVVDQKLGYINPRLDAAERSFKEIKQFQESLQNSFNSLQDSQRYCADQVRNQNQAILDAKNSMVGAAAGSAIDIIRSQNMFAPATLDDKLTSSLDRVNNSLMEHIEAQSQATGNLQQRMDNLNTSDVLVAMVDNINQAYPSLRTSEMALQSHGSQLSTLDLRIQALQKQVEEIRETKHAPVPAATAAASRSPAPPKQDEVILKRLRLELDDLSKDTVRLQRLEKDVAAFKGETSTSLTDLGRQTTVLGEELGSTFFELRSSGEDLDSKVNDSIEKVNTLIEKVKGIEKKVDSLVQKQQQYTAPRIIQPPNTASISRHAFQNPGPVHPPSAPTNRHASKSTNRQASISSDTNSVSAKRKRPQLNGRGSGSPPKSNGFKRSESSRGSPNPKRRRRTRFDDDDSDQDPDYEDEGDPQPGISAHEDE
ncbi:hypothetical protein BKA65DRAFT_545554 [Rhexocercosporidium sp. MPI-PUGE-AT-0058]|nr:hypothetical protein BKA65DRAFT_545554 [Rhexocercosporidium sp. MPI-PUGE-AT-0058]